MFRLLSLCIIIAIITGVSGCKQQDEVIIVTSPTRLQLWNSWVKDQEKHGLKVLSITETKRWMEDNRSKISMPRRVSFREKYSVKEEPYRERGTIITSDHKGNLRVAAKDFTYPPRPRPPLEKWNAFVERLEKFGFKVLSVTESEQWMKDNRSKAPEYQLDMLDIRRRLHSKEVPIFIPVSLDIPGQINTSVVLDHNGKWRRIIMANIEK
ncbi:MAG: hypothetical protein OXU23_22120 [Candidatus Poribacteria bacterium]|nr:hypothetical protein [Candidatus Poribacteria bacterium]